MAVATAPSTTDSATVFDHAEFKQHEQVVFCHDATTGLKAIIGIHNTTLGPALGGTRMWNYANDAEALRDVLRLSRGMTYKAAISGLNLGGGKAVIIGDARSQKTPALMEAFGRFVDSLSGRYITAEDVGMSTDDMVAVHRATDHVTGIPIEMGGSGDPSSVTAYGVFCGMKAAAAFKWGNEDLKGKHVLVQGIGHVGETLVKHLTEAGARVSVSDIYTDRIEHVQKTYGAQVVNVSDVYTSDMDIYAPCALGATLNDKTIPSLKCAVVAGAANNQLAVESVHGTALKERGIIYAPDFLINAGGLINVNSEIEGYDRAESLKRTEAIFKTTLAVLERAEKEGITPHQAALRQAEDRIARAAQTALEKNRNTLRAE